MAAERQGPPWKRGIFFFAPSHASASRTTGGWAILLQVGMLALLLAVFWYFTGNAIDNLRRQSIATGFGFLHAESGFDVAESPIAFSAADSYGRAFLVGVLNTLKVSVTSIVLATILGAVIGIARLSANFLISRLALAYVELLRNVPLLLQLFLWYGLLHIAAPVPRQAWNPVPGVFISNRGVMLPALIPDPVYGRMLLLALIGVVAWAVVARFARRRVSDGGTQAMPLAHGLGATLTLLPAAIVFFAAGAPLGIELPHLAGFNFEGGLDLSPEMTALMGGLSLYTASYIAEIVRGGILAVGNGQAEAAKALGLSHLQSLRFVILPQALRIIVPPMTSQYLNLVKNSTLAVAIGFPDLVFIANTQINQTGQAVEGITIVMLVYLSISLTVSVLMNLYNMRVAVRGR